MEKFVGQYEQVKDNEKLDLAEAKEFIDSLDEQPLREIFAEHFRRSNIDPSEMQFIPFSDVKVEQQEEGSTFLGGLDRGTNEITLYVPQAGISREKLLSALAHEEWHAITNQPSVTRTTFEDERPDMVSHKLGFTEFRARIPKDGVSKEDLIEGSQEKVYQNINEGFTEYFTDIVVDEYLNRVGGAGLDRTALEYERAVQAVNENYGRYKRNAETYTAVVAALSGQPLDVVQKSLLRAYLNNEQVTAR